MREQLETDFVQGILLAVALTSIGLLAAGILVDQVPILWGRLLLPVGALAGFLRILPEMSAPR